MPITITQIRMARAALKMAQSDLANRAGLSLTGYNDIEAGRSSPRALTLDVLRHVLERAGAKFGPENNVSVQLPPDRQFVRGPWGDGDPEKQRAALEIINSFRALKGLDPLEDP